MILDIDYQSEVDMKLRRIDIYMSADVLNNPMVKFLHDLIDHKHLIRKYQLNIHYALGQCSRCRSRNFMTKEKGCLSGGRYCVVDTEYRRNELVKETLRQICLRKQYDSRFLIKYLWRMKRTISADKAQGKWKPGNLEAYSWKTMDFQILDVDSIKQCYNDSFQLVGSDGSRREPSNAKMKLKTKSTPSWTTTFCWPRSKSSFSR